jgi:two-component system sensor histidine kinase PilS (NtrC family)
MLDLHYFGKLSFSWLSSTSIQQTGSFSLLYTIFVNIVAFYLTAVLSGYLAERVRSSESALQEKVIDYEELERLNSAIVHNLYSGLLTVTPEGRIRAFNRHAEELTGLPLKAVYDRPLADVIPGFAPLLQQSDGIASDEIQFVTSTGEVLDFGYRAVPLADKNGERIGTIVHFKDLTVVKRMAEQLKRADRLAAIGGVAARMAHEIRNPLASISGSVQLIAQGGRIAESDRRLVDIVLRETDRLNGLIEEFLGYARPEELQKGAVNLRKLLGELDLLILTDPRFLSMKLSIDCPDSLCVVADHRQLQQVFWNLLLNAAEAMTENGRLQVACFREDRIHPHPNAAGAIRIEVRDNGCGIDGQQLKSLFEPFYTTKPGGSGLGLATVYRIIEAHGGRITVESEPGQGTVFCLLLPSA